MVFTRNWVRNASEPMVKKRMNENCLYGFEIKAKY
jgi:hypothetical protein